MRRQVNPSEFYCVDLHKLVSCVFSPFLFLFLRVHIPFRAEIAGVLFVCIWENHIHLIRVLSILMWRM
jgi:hypothetical protein